MNKNRKGNTMKTRIENKVNEVVEYIISKSPEDITYNEYRILDNRLAVLKNEEMQETRDKEMAEVLGKLWSGGYSNCFAPQRTLPESNDEK